MIAKGEVHGDGHAFVCSRAFSLFAPDVGVALIARGRWATAIPFLGDHITFVRPRKVSLHLTPAWN